MNGSANIATASRLFVYNPQIATAPHTIYAIIMCNLFITNTLNILHNMYRNPPQFYSFQRHELCSKLVFCIRKQRHQVY